MDRLHTPSPDDTPLVNRPHPASLWGTAGEALLQHVTEIVAIVAVTLFMIFKVRSHPMAPRPEPQTTVVGK